MFVKFDCGCVGINIPGNNALVLAPCDLPGDMAWEDYQFGFRDMTGKSFNPLSSTELTRVLNEIGELVSDGYAYRKIRMLLSR